MPNDVTDNLGESPNDIEPIRYSITSYGADFLVDGLVSRLVAGDIYVPRFQRGYVWREEQASRFIESLILGLPVPGIFLAREQDTGRSIIIDGLQRVLTIRYFMEGYPDGRPFRLRGVQPHLVGKTFGELQEVDRRRFLNAIIHATIIKQDEPSDDQSSIYHIFERLNTGGTELLAQEIRSALYEGPFNDLLFELNEYGQWRDIYGRISKRMKDQELILRFFALLYDRRRYHRPMASFLNEFMAANRHFERVSADELRAIFRDTVAVIHKAIGRRAFRVARTINAAAYDAVMYGVAKRLTSRPLTGVGGVADTYDTLIRDDNFLDAIERSTADDRQVDKRLALAEDAFAHIQ